MMGVVARLRRIKKRLERHDFGREAPGSTRSGRSAVVVAAEFADAPLASFYAFASSTTVVEVPLHRCRGLLFSAFSCDLGSGHPFIQTMLALEQGKVSEYVASPLQTFYDAWNPASAAEALGLHELMEDGPLLDAPPLAAVAPWWPVEDLESFRAEFAALIEAENAAKGSPVLADAGCLQHGPVAREKGELEFARCLEIYETVLTTGYRRTSESTDGDVRGQALVRGDGEYVVLVLNGQHRIAAAAAAGLTSVPVRFYDGIKSGQRAVHRSDVDVWPSVRRGWFTVDQALHVFDRIFAGRQPWVSGPEDDLETEPPISVRNFTYR